MRKCLGSKGRFSAHAVRFSRLLVALLIAISTAAASEGSVFSWDFQCTGFQAGTSGYGPQTAVALRDGRTWPVIFSEGTNHKIQAYSLYPVWNPSTQLFWHQIGTDLLTNPQSGMLAAATSPDGRVGAVVNMIGSTQSSAVVGGPSPHGFGGAMMDVRAIDFDSNGNLIKGTQTMVPPQPGIPTLGPIVDIAASPTGDLGVLDANMMYYQKIPMIGSWGYVDLRRVFTPSISLYPQSMDLVMDSVGRPHVAGIMQDSLMVLDFNTSLGRWESQTLATGVMPYIGATLAADSQGRVGAAWVEQPPSSPYGELMYAYKDGSDGWVTQSIATSVDNPYPPLHDYVFPKQGVGLVYDADDLPIISFVSTSGKVWMAYDPVTVPEPSTLVLLASCATLFLFLVGRRRACRR